MLKSRQDRTYDLLFFGAFGLFLTYTVLSTGLYYSVFRGLPFKLMYLIVVAMLVGYELLDFHYTRREWIWAGIAVFMFAISFLVASGALQRSISCIFVFVFCARKISFDRIARFTLIWTGILTSFVVISGYFGFVDNYVVIQSDRVREYMGFRYALFPSAHLLNITSLWIWLHRKKVPLTGAAILAALNVWVYLKTDSRFSFVFSIGLLLAAILLRFFPKILDKLKFLRWAMAGSFLICAAVSTLLTAFYNPQIQWMKDLNRMLSSRLALGHEAFMNHGIPLLGQTVDWVGNGLSSTGQKPVGAYDYVDCLYVNNLINFGPLFVIVGLILVTLAMVVACRRHMDLLLIVMSSVAVHLMLDDLSLYLYYNTFWILLGQLLTNPDIACTGPEQLKPLFGIRKNRKKLRSEE